MASPRVAVVTCPHCGRSVTQGRLEMHTDTCPMRPALEDAIRSAMTGADGCAVSREEYAANAPMHLPSYSTMRTAFGSWAAAVAYFDVPPRKPPVPVQRVKVEKPIVDPQTQDEIDAEVEAAMHVSRAALDAARYCTRQGMTVAVRQDGTPYVRTLPCGRVACTLR
jgi:hypothetical protein